MPLVCKAFNEVARVPSSLWQSIVVDLQQQQAPLRAPAQHFFRVRADSLQSLALFLPPEEAGFAADVLAVLGQQPALKRLVVDFGGADTYSVSTFLAQLGWLRKLMVLFIRGIRVSTPLSASKTPGNKAADYSVLKGV